MIDLIAACQTARDFFGRYTGDPEPAQCRENGERWFFVNGPTVALQVGGLIAAVRKEDGGLEVIGIPTEEDCATLQRTVPVQLPAPFFNPSAENCGENNA